MMFKSPWIARIRMGGEVGVLLSMRWLALFLLVIAVTPCAGQEATKNKTIPSKEKLPSAKSVIDRHLKSIGGLEKLTAIKTLKVTGTVEVAQAGLKGAMTVLLDQRGQGELGLGVSSIDLGPVGKQRSGTDGKVVWAEMAGNSEILTGKKAEQAMIQLTIMPMMRLERLFEKIECVGLEEFEGEACYRIECSNPSGLLVTYFFSKQSGLEQGSQTSLSTSAGDMDVTVIRSEYKEIEGIRYSHHTEMRFPNGMVQAFSLEKLEINKPIPAESFVLPDAILKKSGK